jgi:type IV pilus assembly protein PilO
MNMKEATISPLDAIEGSDDLDMMTITVNFEGNYGQLIKFVNLLDRSPRFLIIESLQAAPQPKGDILTVSLKLNTFIREEAGDVRSGT